MAWRSLRTANGALSCCWDGTVRVWDLASGKELRRFSPNVGTLHGVSFSPDGKYLVTGGAGGFLGLWDLESGKLIHRFRGHTANVSEVAFGPGKRVLSGSSDLSVRLWEVP